MNRLRSYDLNLLVTLDALLDHRGVSRAAKALALSQPAVSHALTRLRRQFGDRLLVREGNVMRLTPRAQELQAPLRAALHEVGALIDETPFDAVTTRRIFRMQVPDLLFPALVPPLVARMRAAAPEAQLRVEAWRSDAELTTTESLVDAVVGFAGRVPPGFDHLPLYRDVDTLIASGVGQIPSPLTWDWLLEQPHVAVVARGGELDPVDGWLASRGLGRRISLVVPNYLQAAHAVAASDLIGIVPGRLAIGLGPVLRLVTAALPDDPGVDEQILLWPRRTNADEGARWFRALIMECVGGRGPS